MSWQLAAIFIATGFVGGIATTFGVLFGLRCKIVRDDQATDPRYTPTP
jgi:hypothetical protein